MPYQLYQFDTVPLPTYLAEDSLATSVFNISVIDLPGGGEFDVMGTDQAKRKLTTLTKTFLLMGASAGDARAQYNALRGLAGWRKRLWRMWDTGDSEWLWARLQGLADLREVADVLDTTVALTWTVVSAGWNGQYHGGPFNLDSGAALDTGCLLDVDDTVVLASSPQVVPVANYGNRMVTNPILTITAGSAAITALSITGPGFQLGTTRAIQPGQSLVIDCGGLSVLYGGADDFALFAAASFGAGHTIDDWIRYQPNGLTDVTVSFTGGGVGSTFLSQHYEGWE